MTPDTWHVTHDTDTWHVTRYMWHVTHGGGWTFSQNFSSPALTVWDRQCLEDSELKDDSLNESVNYEGVYRTAPASPGLLIRGCLHNKPKPTTCKGTSTACGRAPTACGWAPTACKGRKPHSEWHQLHEEGLNSRARRLGWILFWEGWVRLPRWSSQLLWD